MAAAWQHTGRDGAGEIPIGAAVGVLSYAVVVTDTGHGWVQLRPLEVVAAAAAAADDAVTAGAAFAARVLLFVAREPELYQLRVHLKLHPCQTG